VDRVSGRWGVLFAIQDEHEKFFSPTTMTVRENVIVICVIKVDL
jgi:hypothetical protein